MEANPIVQIVIEIITDETYKEALEVRDNFCCIQHAIEAEIIIHEYQTKCN